MHPSNSYASKRFTKGGKGTSKSKIRTKLQATEQDTRNFISKTFDYINPLCILTRRPNLSTTCKRAHKNKKDTILKRGIISFNQRFQ